MRVVLLYNQVSHTADEAERDVLVQAEAVQSALTSLGHEPIRWECTLQLAELQKQLAASQADVVFNLVESLGGSDWLAHTAPTLLDVLQIPYTGSPTEALMISNHKLLAKRWLRQAGLPTPDWVLLESPSPAQAEPSPPEQTGNFFPPQGTLAPYPTMGHPQPSRHEKDSASEERLGLEPVYLIKAVREHASVGLEEGAVIRPKSPEELQTVLVQAKNHLARPVFAERFIEGREFNLSLLAGPEGPQVLPPAEIDFSAFPAGKARIVGYAAKWEEGSFEYHHTPRRFDFPPSDQRLLDRLKQLALACWRLLDLGGYARVDFRVDEAGQPWILEINTNPCLAPDAGFAAAVQHAGLTYAQAIQRILEDAFRIKSSASSILEPVGQFPVPAPASKGSQIPAGYRLRDELRPEDRQAIREMVVSTGFFNAGEIELADELVRERLSAGPKSGYYFLFLESEERPIGYACYGPIAATDGSFDLYWIAVHRAYQARGLGRVILQECEQRIRRAGGRRIYIETSGRPQYTPTQQFYEHCGYQCEARLKDFYAPGDDKIIYVKTLEVPPF